MLVVDKTAPGYLNHGPIFLGWKCETHICVESLWLYMIIPFRDL